MSQYPDEVYDPPPAQPQPVSVSMPASTPWVTYAIIAVTVFVYLLQGLSDLLLGPSPVGINWLEFLGAKFNFFIRQGQLWRFFTPMLLHASLMHIGFNMYALYAFGTGLEQRLGHRRFFLLYILSGFAGSVLSFLFTEGYSIGASGAIFGLIGAEGVFLYQNRKLFGKQAMKAMQNVIFVVAINLFLGLQPRIDNWGHIGGLLGGLIFSWFASPLWQVDGVSPFLRLVDTREPRDVGIGVSLVVIVFCVLAAIGMWFPFVE
ncbi:MAG: rhomboid family intramembrane serine protease [Anaerolineales bacterium]